MNEKLDAKSIDTELLINNIEEMFEINLYTLTSTIVYLSAESDPFREYSIIASY